MDKKKKLLVAILVLILSVFVFFFTLYNYTLSPVSKTDSDKLLVEIKEGSSLDIATTLKEEGLIRSKIAFLIEAKLGRHNNLQASTYEFDKTMSSKKIIEILELGLKYSDDVSISVTFPEGINMRRVASIISENTTNTEDDVFNLLKDEAYLQELISKYWFLSEKILDKDIYYSLEGYLFPDTYYLRDDEVTVKEIFETLLNETDKKLSNYKEEINSSSLDVHELLTLASLIELEAANKDDRKGVAGVFYNRLDTGMSLGSDVTTYYGSKIENWSTSLTTKELSDCSNKYNTRCATKKGLPIGPICNSSIDAIEAAIRPEKSNYYYFVADCNKKTYFSKTNNDNLRTKQRLINEGNWCA